MNRDLLTNAQPEQVAHATMTLLDCMQNLQAENQTLGAAALFFLLCEHWRVDPREALGLARNLMCSTEGERRPEFRAAAFYLRNNL